MIIFHLSKEATFICVGRGEVEVRTGRFSLVLWFSFQEQRRTRSARAAPPGPASPTISARTTSVSCSATSDVITFEAAATSASVASELPRV